MGKSSFALLIACVLAALVAGCGGGGGSTEGSASAESTTGQTTITRSGALTKPELLAVSREICANITREIDEDLKRFTEEHGIEPGEKPTPTEAREIGEEIMLPLMHKQDREHINLGEVNSILDEVEEIFQTGEEEWQANIGHPALAATDPGEVWVKANPMMRRYGFTNCVREEPLAR